MNKLGTKLGAIAMSAVMALSFAPSAAITSLAAGGDDLTDATQLSVPVYRLYNPNSGEHLFTTNENECDSRVKDDWDYEGIEWYAPTEGDQVYRLYNPNHPLGDHHYTASKSEVDNLLKEGWRLDETAFYTADADDLLRDEVISLYNPNAYALGQATHHLTLSEKEAADLVKLGWVNEGVKFYGYAADLDPEVEELTVSIDNTTPKVGDTLRVLIYDEEGNEINPEDVDAKIQWFADGVKITAATSAEYTVLVGDAGVVLSVEVTIGTETYKAMTAAVSEGIAEKLAVSIDNPSPKVGDILAAIVTPDDAVVTYSWTAGDKVVGTEKDLEVTADMLGKKIKVKVTALNSDTATSPETAAVEYEVPKILTAVRKAANSFTLNFDSDAQDIVKVDDIVVISEDKTDVKKITGLDFDTITGKSAVVTVSTPFKDGVTYNVYMKNDETNGSSFVASVGDVAKIEISTTEAEVNTPTKIEFALFDANGVDVTSAVNVDETCIVTFEGNYDNFNNKKASNTTVTMATSGDVCTVTVEYDKNDGKTDQITASKDIKCVAASEKKGTPYFKAAPADTNDTDLCYRFYDPKNSTDTNVTVAINKTALVHFYAQDSDGSAISYDSYEIESADETVATAEIDQATGKWASFTVAGNTKGNVLLELKATKNGAESTYDIPVTVTEQAAPVKAKLAVSKPTMSNAWDNNYYGEITVTVTAADGNKADSALYTVDAPVLKTTNKGVDTDLKGDAIYDGDPDTGFQVDGYDYTAYAAEGGNYVIEAEVTDLTSGKVLTARNTVTVKELPKEAWVRTHTPGTGITLYAPKAFTDVLGDGIDDNTGLSYELWSTLGWITDEEFNALDPTSVATGTVSNMADLALKNSVTATLATGAALTANGGAEINDDVYFLVNTDNALAGQMVIANALDADDLKAAIETAIEDDDKEIYKKKVTTAPTDAAPAVISADGAAVVVDPFTLTDPKPNAAGVAGQDAYAQVYSYWTGEGVKTSYTIEFDDSDKTLGYKLTTDGMSAKLAATMNGLFAGYVHANGSIGVGNVVADNTTRIVNLAAIGYGINIQTYFGKNLVASDAGVTALYGVGQYGALAENADIELSVDELEEDFITRDWTVGGLPAFYTAQKDQVTHDDTFAREGTYKVEFTYWKANSKKATTESAAFTVENDLYVPGVVVKSQYLDSYDQEGWATAVVSEVDLNNNDSSTYSVIDLIDKNGATIADSKTPAKWAVVKEEGVAFFKPLDRTFKLNS